MRAALCCLLLALAGCAAPPAARAPDAAEDAYRLGRRLHADGEHALAVKAYKQALALAPSHVDARNAMAVAYAERGHARQAAAMLGELARAVPPDRAHAYIHNNLGYARLLAGEFGPARQALRTAAALAPDDARAAANLRQLERLASGGP